jgi:hypothetical protein
VIDSCGAGWTRRSGGRSRPAPDGWLDDWPDGWLDGWSDGGLGGFGEVISVR